MAKISKQSSRDSKSGQFVVGWEASKKISTVEGHTLSRSMNGLFHKFSKTNMPDEQRRSELKKKYGGGKS